MLAQVSFAVVHATSRLITPGEPTFFALISSSSKRNGSQILSAKRSPQLVPVRTPGGVGSRCQPVRAIVRAVTATKHGPGLSSLHRVVSYVSAIEVWAVLMRLLSHYQRARSEEFAVVPLKRAALTR